MKYLDLMVFIKNAIIMSKKEAFELISNIKNGNKYGNHK